MYVDNRYDTWMLPGIDFFFIGIGFYTLLCLFLNSFLERFYNRYINLDADRKLYVLKNLAKGMGLSVFLFFSTHALIDKIETGTWYNHIVYKMGYFYCSADVLGLLAVKKLPWNSRLHHCTTFIIATLVAQTNFEKGEVLMEGILIFTYLSACAFMVNLYLGIRHIGSAIEIPLLYICHLNYYAVLLVNLIYQGIMIYRHFSISLGFFTYSILVGFIILDDIQLIRFLSYQKRKLKFV